MSGSRDTLYGKCRNDFDMIMEKTGIKLKNCVKKFIFGLTYKKFAVAMPISKMADTQLTFQNILRKMSEQLLKISAL